MLSSSGLNIDYIKKRSYDDKFIFVFLLKGRDITKLFIAADKNEYYMHCSSTYFWG